MTFKSDKYKALFNAFELDKDGNLTLDNFKLPSEELGSKRKWKEATKASIRKAKDIFWYEMFKPEDSPVPISEWEPLPVSETDWIGRWNKLAEDTLGKKPPVWSTNITLMVFQALDENSTGRFVVKDYEDYLSSFKALKDAKYFEKAIDIFDRLDPAKLGYIDVLRNEELLTWWLLNNAKKDINAGDFFPIGGYGLGVI